MRVREKGFISGAKTASGGSTKQFRKKTPTPATVTPPTRGEHSAPARGRPGGELRGVEEEEETDEGAGGPANRVPNDAHGLPRHLAHACDAAADAGAARRVRALGGHWVCFVGPFCFKIK